MRWVRGMYVCSGGEEKKKKGRGYMGGGGRKKKGEIKWKKEMGSGIYVYGGKKGGVEKKNLKGKKLNWFYLYVHFVWCKV